MGCAAQYAPCNPSSIKANIAHMYGRCSQVFIMTVYLEMVDCSTGEILYTKELSYSFSFTSNDVGFSKLMDVLHSTCKGARIKRIPIQVRFMFHESQNNQSLPFSDINEFSTPYEVKQF